MIEVKPFTTDVLSTHKMFYVLDMIPKNAENADVWIQTPVGLESVDFVDLYSIHDGTIVAAWKHPLQKLSLHNLTVFCDGITQTLNLYPIERIIDIYDRPVDAEFGTFILAKSRPIGGGDWRCDKGMYGPGPFEQENVERVITDISQVVVYEPFLSINGIAHLIYLESNSKSALANEKLNNSFAPLTGRTIQETLRLIYEWSVLCDEPFNSSEEIALTAKSFLGGLRLSPQEMAALRALPPMQVANYILGSDSARVRPNNIPSLSSEVKNIVFKRMASSSFSAVLKIHGIENTYGSIEIEKAELLNGISRFREYYNIPAEISINDEMDIMNHCAQSVVNGEIVEQQAYVFNQLRLFKHKQLILDKVDNNEI